MGLKYRRGVLPDSADKFKAVDSGTMVNKEKTAVKNKIEFEISCPRYRFKDIVLTEKQKKDILAILNFHRYRSHLMDDWGLGKVMGDREGLFVNLYGPSGVGKTVTAHAMADKLGKGLILVNYAEIESKYVGETSKNLCEMFSFAEASESILLFDEADALLSKRVTNMTNSTDTSVNQTKSVLLNIMNEYRGMVIFTTNYIENYDFAFMRRIPFQVKFSLPDAEQRESIWRHYLECGLPNDLDIVAISKKYDKISGSDISNAIFMAALSAVSNREEMVGSRYFYESIEHILQAKKDNEQRQNEGEIVSQREVSEEYALEQIELGKRNV